MKTQLNLEQLGDRLAPATYVGAVGSVVTVTSDDNVNHVVNISVDRSGSYHIQADGGEAIPAVHGVSGIDVSTGTGRTVVQVDKSVKTPVVVHGSQLDEILYGRYPAAKIDWNDYTSLGDWTVGVYGSVNVNDAGHWVPQHSHKAGKQ